MICEKCKTEDRKSTIRFSTEIVTSELVDNYYDEEGKLHIHDPNITETTYRCSNGHEWSERETEHCGACK